MADIPVFPIQYSIRSPYFHGVAPATYQWAPKFLPEQLAYINGSGIAGHPRLDAVAVHIYIDVAGTEETRTITRAELVAIHTALTTFSTHEWIGVFTNSLSSIQAIRHHHTNSGTTSAKHYHHHMLLVDSITTL